MIKVKVVIYCEQCSASAEVLAELNEERDESSCRCCSHGTGRFFIDAEIYGLPDGWTKSRRWSVDYFCPEHKADE